MRKGRPWLRAVVALAVLGALTIAVIASPVGAAKKGVTRRKAKTIATNTFNTLFPASFNSMFPASFNSAISGANKQDSCANGTVLASLYIQNLDLAADFSTSGVTHSFNCAGSAIEARRNSIGDYDVRVPGITTPALTQSDSIVATLSVGNDEARYATYESTDGNDYIEVNVFDGTGAPVDDEVALAFYNRP
ncbi:MAG: hypothetical protein ACRDH8_00545 [Actinomycetota bacterium]